MQITLACGGLYKFYRLRWSHWGEPVTRAVGLAWGNKCDAGCPHFHGYPVRLVASDIWTCPNGEHRYLTLKWSFPNQVPSEIMEPDHETGFSCQYSGSP